MILKRDIVDRAFKKLAMSGYELDDAPEDSQDILQELDDMMAELQSGLYDFGYSLRDDVTDSYLGDESGIKRDALSAISGQLALRICNLFGKPPPPLLVNEADATLNALLTKYQIIPEAVSATKTWRFGSGNRGRY